MKKTSTLTLTELTEFTKNEEKMTEMLFTSEKVAPKTSTIQSLLNFSKSLSVRTSKQFGTMEFVLS